MKIQKLRIDGLSSTYMPSDDALLVFGHGAGADYQHPHMTAIAEALQKRGIGTLRFNFPFMESKKQRVDSRGVCLTTIAAALTRARELAGTRPLLVGGHSFGGRMATHFSSDNRSTQHYGVSGVVCFSFPLHPANKPGTERASHLPEINKPQLYLSGNRDTLANTQLLERPLAAIPQATLHWLETADHSFKILVRTRRSTEDIYEEAARVASEWLKSAC